MSGGRNERVNLPHDRALQKITLFGHISHQKCINYINVQCLLLPSPKIYFYNTKFAILEINILTKT